MWVYRLGFEQAKRYLLTGDEIPAPKAAEIGLICECVPDDELLAHATALARRMALLPGNQPALVGDARQALRRRRPSHPGGPGLRGPLGAGGLPRGGPRPRRPLRRLRLPPALTPRVRPSR
jgi:enoyl-CoA hydratase/carnithine racemase